MEFKRHGERGIEFPVLILFFSSFSHAHIQKRAVYKLLLKNKRLRCTAHYISPFASNTMNRSNFHLHRDTKCEWSLCVRVSVCIFVCFVYSLLMVNRVNALWTDSIGLNVILEEMARFSFVQTLSLSLSLSHFPHSISLSSHCCVPYGFSTFCHFILCC